MIWFITANTVLLTVLAIRILGLTKRINYLEENVYDLQDHVA